MTDFIKTQPAGRMIARLFAKIGWAIVIAGLILALTAAFLDRVPGTEAGPAAATALSRALAALPGLGVALFGLFAVMMAAQTRAAIDSADIAREMLVLARRRPISLLAAVPPLGEAVEGRVPSPKGASVGEDRSSGAEDLKPAPPALTRFTHAPVTGTASEGSATVERRKEPRAEPVFAASTRPKPAPGKVHPIFSARPPR